MDKKEHWADPAATLLFLFSISSFTTCGIYAGVFTGEANLFNGILMLVSFPVYMLGGIIYTRMGDTYSANIWFIFGFIFGGLMGLGNVIEFAGKLLGTEIPISMYGIPLIVVGFGSGLSLLFTITGESIPFITWFLAHCWCITSGIEYFLPIEGISLLNMLLSGLVGIGTGYMMTSELLVSIGRKALPMGKPLWTGSK